MISSELQPIPTLTVKEIQIRGSSILSLEKIEELTRPYRGKTANLPEIERDIQEVIEAINQIYEQAGYLGSGAFFPPQDLSNGIIIIQVVEGELEKIEIEGLGRLRASYIRERLENGGKTPLNLNRLSASLERLQNDPVIESIRAELKAGTYPNTRILAVEVEEAPPFEIGFSVDNYQSFVVGEYQGTANLRYHLLGIGDALSLQYNRTEGLSQIYVGYTVPINARDGTVSFSYERGDGRVIQQPLEPFDLTTESQKVALRWRQPLLLTRHQEFALAVSFEWQQNISFLLGEPFSFLPEVPNGAYRVTALRFSQEYINRSSDTVVAFRSEFSVGLDWLNGTTIDNPSGLDGRFFLWRGQLEWAQRLTDDFIWRLQLTGQLTPDVLLPSEAYQIGGIYTVRGYPYNFLSSDNGFTSRLELRYTPIDTTWGTLTLYPFFDFALIGNNYFPTLSPSTVASVGLGLEWYWQETLRIRLDLADPITRSVQGEQNFLFSIQWLGL